MRRLLSWTDGFLLGVAVVFAAGLLGCVALQVFFRYVLQAPLPWSEELARYLFVWSSLLAAAVVVGKHDHFSIPFAVELLPARLRWPVEVLGTLLCIAFALIMVVKGTNWSWRMRSGSSPVLQIPQGAVYAVIPLTGLYMIVHLVVRLATLFGNARAREGRPC